MPVIDAKHDALIMYKSIPNQQNHQALTAARSLAQKTARPCANNYWLRLSSSIQMASWSGNIRVMYEGIKQATGKSTKRSAPVKSKAGDVIKDRDQQMSQWVEHYLESTPEKTLSPKRRLKALKTCLFLKSWTLSPLWRSSAKPSTPWRVEKTTVRTAFPRSYQMRQICTTGTTSRTPVSVLEGRQGAPRHA